MHIVAIWYALEICGHGRCEFHIVIVQRSNFALADLLSLLRLFGHVYLPLTIYIFGSLLYGAEDPSIAGMVLDSPFSDLVDLMMELVDTYKIRLPKFTVSRS